MTGRTIQCAYCEKKFVDESGRYSHAKMKHYGKKNPRPKADADESFADRAIQASIDSACGICNFDAEWLLP